MVLVDTSVWIDHFRKGNSRLIQLLEEGQVLTHPLIIGELACGNLKNRRSILEALHELPQAQSAMNEEVLFFIEDRTLPGKGLGIVDIHLLASCLISTARLFTLDKKLQRVFGNLSKTNPV